MKTYAFLFGKNISEINKLFLFVSLMFISLGLYEPINTHPR